MIFKKNRIPLPEVVCSSNDASELTDDSAWKKRSYDAVLELVDRYSGVYPYEEQMLHLDFVSGLVKQDLQSDYKTRLIYSGNMDVHSLAFLDKKLDFQRAADQVGANIETNSDISIDFANDTVFVRAWNKRRLLKNVTMLAQEAFINNRYDYNGYFCKTMGYAWIDKGNHSITVASQLKKGNIELPLLDDEQAFPLLLTDGAYWINAVTGEKLGETADFRLALIYELARRRYYLTRTEHEERG